MSIKVVFQGEPGAYSEQACRQFFGDDVDTLPRREFRDLFNAIRNQEATHVMLPVENSLAGTVIPAYDLLIDHDLRIQAEEIVKVEHCLMAPHGVELKDIKRVISHPQALAQCASTFQRMGLEPVTYYDTAGSAKDLANSKEPHTAALASALSAETYNLNILMRDLQDLPHNYTRFFVLGHEDVKRGDPSKTSIVFTTRHVPGALARVIAIMADNDLNLTKIESRPRRNVPWLYRFHVDFYGHEDDANVREALINILKQASFLKVLGSYPAKEMSYAPTA